MGRSVLEGGENEGRGICHLDCLKIVSAWAWLIPRTFRTGVSLQSDAHPAPDVTAGEMDVVFVGTRDLDALLLSLCEIGAEMNGFAAQGHAGSVQLLAVLPELANGLVSSWRGRTAFKDHAHLGAVAEAAALGVEGRGQVVLDFGLSEWGEDYSLRGLEKRSALGKACVNLETELLSALLR